MTNRRCESEGTSQSSSKRTSTVRGSRGVRPTRYRSRAEPASARIVGKETVSDEDRRADGCGPLRPAVALPGGAQLTLSIAGCDSYGCPWNETLIGYARCSTDEQDLTAQRQTLLAFGVALDRIYIDHGISGTKRGRPGLDQALAAVRTGDTLVVPKLDRLARSVPDARDIGDTLARRCWSGAGQVEGAPGEAVCEAAA